MQQDSNRLEAIGDLAWNGYLFSQPDSAFYFAMLQYELAESIGNKKCMAHALRTQGIIYAMRSNHEQAYEYLSNSLKLYEEIDDKQGVANIFNAFGNIYKDHAQYEQALENYEKSITLYKELDDKNGIATTYGNIGNIYHEQGDWKLALEYFNQALMLNEETENKRGKASILGALGSLHEFQNDLDKAIEYYEQSINIYKDLGDNLGLASILNRMGNVNTGKGDLDKAREQYNESLRINEEMDIESGIAYCYYNMGIICEYKGDYAEALEYTQKGLKIGEDIKYVSLQISSLSQIGSIHYNQGDYYSALSFGSRALSMAREYKIVQHIMNSAEVLYKSYKAIGDFDNALEMHELYTIMKDSIRSEEIQRAVIRQEYKFAYQQEALADSISQVEKDYQMEMVHQGELREKNKTKNIFLSSGIFVLLLAGGLWSRVRYIRKANARLEIEKERAEHSEQFKQQFLANMSHEIRTPMNAVLGMTNLTLDTSLSDKQRKYLKAIRKSSLNLLVIINDILDLSKLEAGKMELEKTPFRLSEQIEQVYDTLRFKAEEKGLSFELSIADDVPAVLIGDPLRLYQVLMNLCGNAIKFTEKGSVRILVDKIPDTEATLQFKVIDTGIGIPEDKIDRLFNTFQQLDASTSRKYGGTGLGLSISKSLVEMHKGELEIKSAVGKGSEFSFILPYQAATQEQIARLDYDQHTDANALQGISILLAEDNEYNRIVINDTLENLVNDLSIDHAENGKLAIQMLTENDYDIILMDANMPEMDGLEATKHIRLNMQGKKQNIPIIALTASVLNIDVNNCLEAGMNAYIPKPFTREELVRTLARFYNNPGIANNKVPTQVSPVKSKKGKLKAEVDDVAVTDMGFLNEFCEGDSVRMKKYIELYLKSTPENLEKINSALSSDDYSSLKSLVHTMKPHLGYMGMAHARRLAEEIEFMIIDTPEKEKLVSLVDLLNRDCNSSFKELS